MHVISIDIETFSDIDLGKCGVYRYAESPSFDILLFSYSIDDGQIKLIDLASGEKLPDIIGFKLFPLFRCIRGQVPCPTPISCSGFTRHTEIPDEGFTF
jgi:hypothetical protein